MPRKKKTEQDTPAAAAQETDPAGSTPCAVEHAMVTYAVSRIVVFRLDEQLYALPIESVQEIQQIVELTPVPDSAPAIVGMIDVRGRVVPAIDMRALVGLGPAQYQLDTPMILCRTHGRLVALIVDAVDDVLSLPEGCIQAPSKLYALADRMIGICRLDIGLIVVLDPDRLVPDIALSASDSEEGGF